MQRRRERINKISDDLVKEAYRAYTGKKDYKRALQIYTLLATSQCVPGGISRFSKNMMARLSRKIENTHQ